MSGVYGEWEAAGRPHLRARLQACLVDCVGERRAPKQSLPRASIRILFGNLSDASPSGSVGKDTFWVNF